MISFVYFDVGGVLVKDFSGNNKWDEMKKDLGVKEEDDQEFDNYYDRVELQIHTGRETDSIIPEIASKFSLQFPKDYSLLEDFIKRFEQNSFIWPVVKEISKSCQIGLLTNMYPNMLTKLKSRQLIPETNWNVIIDSSKVHFHKPQVQIYEIAQSKLTVPKNEVLFIDNTRQNIQAADEFGWQTFLFDSKNPEQSSQELLNYFHIHYLIN